MKRRGFLQTASGAAATVIARNAFAASPGQQNAPARLTPPASGLIQVACAISKGTTEIDYIGPEAVFETWSTDPVTKKPTPRFKIFTVGESKDPVDGRIPDFTFDTAPTPHLVVVPAQRGSPALVAWLKRVAPMADLTMSVCIGARHLAAARLLDGKTATTHHGAIAQFEKEYPNVHWIRNVRFVEHDKVATGGRLTAGIDLALHVVERYFDRASALAVAEHLEYDGRRWISD